jgi:DNA topoisomerase-2
LIDLRTPRKKAIHKKEKLSFYTDAEYDEWRNQIGMDISKYEIKYYKGLGTSTSQEAKEYFDVFEQMKVEFVMTDETGGEEMFHASVDALELAFQKSRANDRKEWLKRVRFLMIRYECNNLLDFSPSPQTIGSFPV